MLFARLPKCIGRCYVACKLRCKIKIRLYLGPISLVILRVPAIAVARAPGMGIYNHTALHNSYLDERLPLVTYFILY